MPEPLEETLLAGVVALLKGLTGTRPWGGTYPDEPLVVRDPVSISGMPRFPFIIVSAASGSGYTLGETDVESTGGAIGYKNLFRMNVSGWMRGTSDAAADTWRLRLRKDILDTLCGPLTPIAALSTSLQSIYPEGETTFDEGEVADNIRMFTQVYRATLGDVLVFT